MKSFTFDQPLSNEKKKNPSPTQKELECLEDYQAHNPEKKIPKEDLRESGPEIAKLKAMFENFEATHNLEELNAIINLSPKEAPSHLLREPARIALNPITVKLKALKKETDIAKEKFDELAARYEKLSQAVGIINKDIVDHTRTIGNLWNSPNF